MFYIISIFTLCNIPVQSDSLQTIFLILKSKASVLLSVGKKMYDLTIEPGHVLYGFVWFGFILNHICMTISSDISLSIEKKKLSQRRGRSRGLCPVLLVLSVLHLVRLLGHLSNAQLRGDERTVMMWAVPGTVYVHLQQVQTSNKKSVLEPLLSV